MRPQLWRTANAMFLALQCAFLIPWELVDAVCVPSMGCDTAYAFYRVQPGENLTAIGQKFQTTEVDIRAVNPVIVDVTKLVAGSRLYIPFSCDCINDELLHKFQHQVSGVDSVYSIATDFYQNLTQESWVAAANSLPDVNFLLTGNVLDIPVNCSCGNPDVTSDYGLFLTYALVEGVSGNLSGVASDFNVSTDLLQKFNPGVVWAGSQTTQYAFIPVTDRNGNYPRYIGDESNAGKTTNTGVIVGAAIGGSVVLFTLLALVLYCGCVQQPRKRQKLAGRLIIKSNGNHLGSGSELTNILSSSLKASSNPGSASLGSQGLAEYNVDKSVEFTYEELANATENFSVANKIGEGGFAVVFYGVIRGQKLAIKRMTLQATKEFMAELKVLTHVHHTNLVQLIGYCTTDYLFLVYEFVENGTLDQHLHSAKDVKVPLSWSSRVQIALDAARGLEYIHEHTRPSYIHRDIKSANILLDKECRAKVADFGLTKLIETRIEGKSAATNSTRVVGTWGYMPPEYARFGDVSLMVDVYAFGIVLLEILSGREAIMRSTWTEESTSAIEHPKEDQRALVNYFDLVLKASDGKDKLPEFMDPALQDNYPSDAAWKMAQLAGACTQELPGKRPTMRKAVVALMAMSSTTYEWETSAFVNHRLTTPSG